MATIVDGTVGITFPAGGVGNPAGAAVGTTDTQTLTNKTLTGAVMNGTLGATTPASVSATTIVASNLLTQAAGANIASAATIDLSTATGNGCRITGTTAISAVTMTTGQQVLIVADGALPLTYNATTNKLNSGAASVTLAAGDMVFYSKDLSGIVHGNIIKADGTAVVAATSSDTGSSSLYGAGTDGNVTISSGTTTLTRDMYYANLTMTGGKINPAGYRIFVNDTFDISGYTTGGPAIERLSGTAAGITVGVGIAGAAGGSGGSTTYLTAGGTGAAGAASATNGGAGGASGAGGTGVIFDPGWGGTYYPGDRGGGSGAAGTVTAIPIYRRIPYLTSGPSSFINGGGRGSGGGGGGGGIGNATGKEGTHPVTGPTGGNGGAGGGVLDIVCKTFKTSGSNPAGLITATGGNGSNGVAGSNAGGSPNGISGGSGGGGGGGGGWIFFCYAIHNGTGVSNLIKADGGTGGNGASGGGGAATAGGGGNGGSGGRITLFNLTTNVITETTGSAGSAASGTTGGAGNSFGATV